MGTQRPRLRAGRRAGRGAGVGAVAGGAAAARLAPAAADDYAAGHRRDAPLPRPLVNPRDAPTPRAPQPRSRPPLGRALGRVADADRRRVAPPIDPLYRRPIPER